MADRDRLPFATPRSRRADVGLMLIEKIRALLGPGYRIAMIRERPWASVNFAGTRHHLALYPENPDQMIDTEELAERLDALDFALEGRFVADTLVNDRDKFNRLANPSQSAITVELLTIIDPVDQSDHR